MGTKRKLPGSGGWGKRTREITHQRCEAIKGASRIRLFMCKNHKGIPVHPSFQFSRQDSVSSLTNKLGFQTEKRQRFTAGPPAGPCRGPCQTMNQLCESPSPRPRNTWTTPVGGRVTWRERTATTPTPTPASGARRITWAHGPALSPSRQLGGTGFCPGSGCLQLTAACKVAAAAPE